MRRHLIGLIALVLLSMTGVLLIWPMEGTVGEPLKAACSRGGAFAAVAWLAYHEVRRVPPWLWPGLIGLMVVLVVRPRYLWVAIPIVIALAVLKPRVRQR